MTLYHSPRGLYDFQAEGVATCYLRPDNLAVWDTGLGKTHLAMATAALLFEDDLIDLCLIICERNKLKEWQEDFERFTQLEAVTYHGAPAKRERLRGSFPDVVISTYETSRNDAISLVEVEGRKSKKMVPGPLLEGLTGQRVLVVYDEITKLGNRGSQNHKSHDFMIQHLRGNGACRVMGLTATPIERSPENIYNLGRIFMPKFMTVAQFENWYVATKDFFGNYAKFKNLSPDTTAPGVTPFSEFFKPIILRKRKTDADVVDQFPKTVSEVTYVELSKAHRDFYNTVDEILSEADDVSAFQVLRQIAGHPLSLLQSEGKWAKAIVDTVGEDGLAKIGSAKLDRLVEYLIPIVHGQGAQVVVFSFFGPSILPLIREALEAVKPTPITVAMNHGKMGDRQRADDMAAFKAGERDVFLTSDAGARGINLPQALYVVEFEMAITHALQTQRLNRIHRIDSEHPSVTFQSFIALDTIEEAISRLVIQRHEWQDEIVDNDDPEGHITASMRRDILKRARAKVAV